jgi:hypothetical protein
MKYLLVLTGLLILGCGDGGSRYSEDEKTEESETVGQEIADDLISTQDRARAVEDVVMQQKRDLDAAIEDAEEDD